MRGGLLCLLMVVQAGFCFGQVSPAVRQPDGGGEYLVSASDEMSAAERAAIVDMLSGNKVQLMKQGKWAQPVQQATAFQWPLKKAGSFNDNGYCGISNYIDQNKSYPNQVTDYNCGTRSYDLSSGYNHRGTDIFTWPFGWDKMRYNLVEIVAAAPGTIIGKSDGNTDQNCALCSSCNWNAVYVRHADGSVAWYGHMKTGTLTSKALGATVVAGEYLGIVGSSGSSTSPHLHFEVWTNDSYTTLVDPWAGPCNALNGTTSWWASQEPYRVSTLQTMKTHGVPPTLGACPASESVNEKRSFVSGQTVYLSSYYRDQLSGQSAVHTLRRPDNTVYQTWNQTFADTYNASYWYYSFTLPNPAPTGVWKYEISYNGTTQSTSFGVNQQLTYVFNGNGEYYNGTNWQQSAAPPNPVPSGVEVIINTSGTNECVVNFPVTILPGAKITVKPNSRVKLPENFRVQ